VAESPAAASKGVEAALTMLSDDAAVRGIVMGNSGIAEGLARDTFHISLSTISTALARELASEHAVRGQGFLSATVFGRPDAAEAAKLIVVPAGPGALIARARPLFDAIGRQTTVAGGEPWHSNALKVCGNFMIAAMMEAFGEAFATMRKSGVDEHVFLEVMNGLFGSPVYANYGRIIVERQFTPAGFALKLGLKDLRLALETAQECASPMPLASLLRDHLLAALAQGQGEMDWSSISQVVARNAGL